MSCALIAEAAAWAKDKGTSLFGLLLDIYWEFGCYRESLSSVYREGKSGAEEIKNMMHGFRNHPPATLAGSQVIRIDDYEMRRSADTRTGKVTTLTLPVSDVLQYITEDETKVSIRPSGTEPKIKFYFSVRGELAETADYRKVADLLDQKIEQIKKELGI